MRFARRALIAIALAATSASVTAPPASANACQDFGTCDWPDGGSGDSAAALAKDVIEPITQNQG